MLHIKPTGNILVKTPTILAVIGFIMLPALAAADVQSNVKPDIITHYNFNSDTGVKLDAYGMPAAPGYMSKSVDDSVNAEIEARMKEQRASTNARLQVNRGQNGGLSAGRSSEAERQRDILRSEDMQLSTGGNLQSYVDSRSTVIPR